MKAPALLLAAVATLAAACSQEKTTETATETTVAASDTLAYRSPADVLAARIAQDARITDPVVVERIKTVYYVRGRKMNNYLADTAGRYAAMKMANDEANRTMQTVLTEPAQYNTYTSNMATYYAGEPYTLVVAEPMAPGAPSLRERVGEGSAVKKMERESDGDKKTKFENGAKIKRDDDGSMKIKRADGTKIKIDEDGKRTVK